MAVLVRMLMVMRVLVIMLVRVLMVMAAVHAQPLRQQHCTLRAQQCAS